VQAELLRLARLPSPAGRPPGLPRLAYVSPLPPECSGIADYSADLVPALCEHFHVDVFVEQGRIDAEPVTSRCAVRDAASLRARADEYDAVIYNFGNSHFHTWMADLIADVPGVGVLHDFYLGGLVWSIGDQPGRAGVRFEQLHYGHGHGALAECLRGRDQGEAFFRYPCNRGVLENATGIVVHSGEALRLARRWFGDAASADWVRIPLVRAPARPRDRHEARRRLGLPESSFVVCNFGLVGATKLNHRLLQAWLDSSLAREPDGLLVFVGDAGPSDYSRALRSRIAGSGLGERVRITGWADGETFRDYLAAADLAVQLRSHSRGETSATVLDCMNHGLATIVNAHGSMAELPAEAVRVIPDAFEHGQLVEALEDLRRDAPGRRALGERARALIARDHAPERCARMARDAIEQFAERGRRREAELRPVIERLGPDPGDEAARLDLAERLVIGSRSPFRLPQLLLDVTETARTDRRTGIERVARALALALLESPPEGYRVEPVVLSQAGGRWHYRAACAFAAELLGVSPPLADRPIDISRGDRLLGLDISGETFVRASDDGLFDRLRDGGVDCRMMVFDLLPVARPECFPPGADRSFGAWLERVARLDGAVCISGTVAGSLRAWMRDRHADRAPSFSIESFPLGADVAAAAPTRGLPHDAEVLLARLAAEPTVLMVGTLEPRKRHLQALEAFSLLWQRGRRVNLVIVGRAGWQHLPRDQQRDIPELLHALRTHPESGRRLLWLDGASDEYLERVYAAASGLLAASIDEGFGLPLVEAAVKGLPVLARDISVFREVAGGTARYFHADTGAQLAEAVDAWMQSGFEPRPDRGAAPITWKRSAEDLLRVMLAPRPCKDSGCEADTQSD
jgi:glycosyltransferase involved in cell wall biosynthesis